MKANTVARKNLNLHSYEVRPRDDRRGVDLISDALPFGRLWYGEPNAVSDAIGYAKFRSRSHDAVIPVYDESGQRDRDARARGRFQRMASSFLPRKRRAAAINGKSPHNTVPGEVALCIDRACRIRSRKRPALERESKVQKKE